MLITAAVIIYALKDAIAWLFYILEALLARFLDFLYETFMVFAGVTPITNKGNQSYLIDYFLNNDLISTLYWGMALIGIAMTFGFGIWALIKKFFDSTGEKMKTTNGQILTNMFKAILIILLMTAIVSATMTATGTLMQQLDDLFNNIYEYSDPSEIYFDDEDYATMFRIIDTIDNFSLNPSYNNRININSCYNAIRSDLYVLARNGVFDFSYDVTDSAKASWQYALRQIYLASDVNEDLPLDIYNSAVTIAITNIVDTLETDATFIPLSYYYRGYNKLAESNTSVLGRTVMLAGSFEAAKTSKYNKNPDIMDDLRRPFYQGSKNIFDVDEAEEYFDYTFGSWNHIIVLLMCAILIFEFLKILVNCVARIFNIVLLYITAPAFVAVMPLDDGGKFKQWCTAFVIQSLSIFGTVIAVRLLMVFVPLILSSDLVIFSSSLNNMVAKLVMIIGICFTAQKAGGLISGILADNAGYQSLMAGDVGSGAVSKGLELGGKVLKAGAKVGGLALSAFAHETGLATVGKKIGDRAGHAKDVMRDKGGIVGGMLQGWTTDKEDDKKEADQKEKAKEESTVQFRNKVTDALDMLTGKPPENKDKPKTPPKENPVQKPPVGENQNPIKGTSQVGSGLRPQNGQGSVNNQPNNQSNNNKEEPKDAPKEDEVKVEQNKKNNNDPNRDKKKEEEEPQIPYFNSDSNKEKEEESKEESSVEVNQPNLAADNVSRESFEQPSGDNSVNQPNLGVQPDTGSNVNSQVSEQPISQPNLGNNAGPQPSFSNSQPSAGIQPNVSSGSQSSSQPISQPNLGGSTGSQSSFSNSQPSSQPNLGNTSSQGSSQSRVVPPASNPAGNVSTNPQPQTKASEPKAETFHRPIPPKVPPKD